MVYPNYQSVLGDMRLITQTTPEVRNYLVHMSLLSYNQLHNNFNT